MFQSPLKTVAEKIKPTDNKSSVSSLRFDRSSDFKKFIKFIKNETEQLEKIKLPTTTEIKGRGGSKLPGAAGILGLGLFGLIASLFGGDDKGKGDDKFRVGGAEASSIPTVPPLGLGNVIRKTPVKLATKTPLKTVLTKKRQNVINRRRDRDKARKARRERRITNKINQNNKKFINEFERRRNQRIRNARIQLGLEYALEDFEVQQILDQDKGKFPGQMDQELADKITKEFKKKGIEFQDALDPKTRSKVYEDIKIDELLNKIETPMTLQDIELLQKLATEKDIPLGAKDNFFINLFKKVKPTQDAIEAQEILDSPEVKRVIKEDKFQKITGPDTPKARSFFGRKFTPKYVLDDFFTGIGQKTKGFRDFMSRPFTKSSGKPTGLGKALMPAMGFGSKLLRGGGFGLDLFSAIFATAELIDGFVVGDNILTAYYDLGVAIHNAFEPDKTKLMFYITKSRNVKKNAFTDKKNQEILQKINEAKKSQVNNNQVSAQEGSSGIVPFAKAVTSSPMGITMTPTIYSWKFVTEKLYKQ